jgi:hypothetical protein
MASRVSQATDISIRISPMRPEHSGWSRHELCFRRNIFKAVAASYQQGGQIPATITAWSPVTQKTYELTCGLSDGEVSCTTSAGSGAEFSLHSVQVY